MKLIPVSTATERYFVVLSVYNSNAVSDNRFCQFVFGVVSDVLHAAKVCQRDVVDELKHQVVGYRIFGRLFQMHALGFPSVDDVLLDNVLANVDQGCVARGIVFQPDMVNDAEFNVLVDVGQGIACGRLDSEDL